ncbi:hypothetical protein ACU686_38735 [Yinghuangia aomiensis]
MSPADPVPVLDPGPAAEIGRYPMGEVVERTEPVRTPCAGTNGSACLPQVGREAPRSGYTARQAAGSTATTTWRSSTSSATPEHRNAGRRA